MASGWTLLSDFDGTIVKDNASLLILSKYAEGDWARYDEMLSRGEITFEECIRSQFRLIRASESLILNDYDQFVSTRDSFDDLVSFAKNRQIPFTIVSGGIDFVIKEFLARNHCNDSICLHVGRTKLEGGVISISFPTLRAAGSISFKDDLVLQQKSQGLRVIYIGDGSSDFRAASASDIAFAVRGSSLAKLGAEAGAPFNEFDDFSQVVSTLSQRLG